MGRGILVLAIYWSVDPVTPVTPRNPSSSKIGYGQETDKTKASASPESHVTNVTTFFEKEASKQAEVATSVESFVDEMELENEGHDFEEFVVTPETKTASESELLPENGYSSYEALQPSVDRKVLRLPTAPALALALFAAYTLP